MNNNFLNKLKVVELSRFFITQYNYREVEIKNVEGVFIENRMAKYPLIRISGANFTDIAAYNEDLTVIKRVVNEYSIISKIDDVKCLCIYFDGIVDEKVDNIYSVIIKDNEDIAKSSILMSEFPQMPTLFNVEQTNKFMVNNNKQTTNNKDISQEKNIVDMFNFKEISRKTRFSRYFAFIFFIANAIAIYLFMNQYDFLYNLSFYEVFTIHLQQYHRLFTGLFLNNGILYVICFSYFFFQYSTFIELKIGTKKTISIFTIGIIMILASMLFVSGGSIFIGSYPLLALVVGTYLSILFLPNEKDLLKFNVRNIFFAIVVLVVFAFMDHVNLIGSLIAFFTGAACVFAFNVQEKGIDKRYLYGVVLIFICMAVLRFIPNQTLARDFNFEKNYIKYVSYHNEELGQKFQDKLNKHYEDIGASDYE